MTQEVGTKYHRLICTLEGEFSYVDVYRVLDAFQVTSPAVQHAIKKLLCAGLRNKGSEIQDLEEAKESVQKAIDLHNQKCKGTQ